MGHYRDILATCTVASIPNLDTAVFGALELLAEVPVPALALSHLQRPLVLGSGNAALTAQIVFAGKQAVFADESSYEAALAARDTFDGVVVFSASGKKHAIAMVQQGLATGVPTYLVTNTPNSDAGQLLSAEQVFVYPKNREPYTYNTSTYLSPIFGTTGEDAAAITNFIQTEVSPKLLRNFGDYTAYTLVIPAHFEFARAMLRTKFDELFGPMIVGRVFTDEEIKHAKTVVQSGGELFISFGVENKYYGLAKNRLGIPLPADVNYGALIAISYYVVGKIQAAYPPYFAQSIQHYTDTASKIFNQTLLPIVD